jgi:hypothetical protein
MVYVSVVYKVIGDAIRVGKLVGDVASYFDLHSFVFDRFFAGNVE